MKNKFKKSDAQGNKLPEKIGKGINEEHLKEVLEERNNKDSVLNVRISSDINEKLIKKCENNNVSKSFYIQELLKNHFKYEDE